jgi:serine-type D-Ala-D-Ala endopeptidase (penicillin-binding protein 7)
MSSRLTSKAKSSIPGTQKGEISYPLKKSLLSLTLIAFLALPILNAPEVLAVSQSKSQSVKSKRDVSKSKPKTKPRRISTEPSPGGELRLRASSALVVDQNSGLTLYAKNIDAPASIASITKLMTAMVTMDSGLPLNEEIAICEEDVDRLKFTGSRLALGSRWTRGQLIHLALIASENRAAAALSRAYPGGQRAFVAAMNRRALEIGMRDSRFVDGTGLDSGNLSTAADLAKMVDAAYHYPLIREITSTGTYDVSLPGTQVVRTRKNGGVHKVSRTVERHMAFNNTNMLTRSKDWDIGVSKTGYINEAGHCLVMQTRIADQKVIMVLLDSAGKGGRIVDARRIRGWLEHESRVATQRGLNTSTSFVSFSGG